MGPLGIPETIVIFILALLLFGPKKLPELGKTIGKAMTEFRRASSELRSTWDREMSALERETESLRNETQKLENEISSSVSYDDSYNNSYYDSGYEYGYGADPETGVAPNTDSTTVGVSAIEGAEQSATTETVAAATESTPGSGAEAAPAAGPAELPETSASAANGAESKDAVRS